MVHAASETGRHAIIARALATVQQALAQLGDPQNPPETKTWWSSRALYTKNVPQSSQMVTTRSGRQYGAQPSLNPAEGQPPTGSTTPGFATPASGSNPTPTIHHSPTPLAVLAAHAGRDAAPTVQDQPMEDVRAGEQRVALDADALRRALEAQLHAEVQQTELALREQALRAVAAEREEGQRALAAARAEEEARA